MRVPFSKIFSVLPDGFSPLSRVEIRGIALKPGVWLGEGMSIPGVELMAIRGRDLEVEVSANAQVIRGAY
ncbi:MAG: hypothetical protein JWM27_333 [Gemmatimonadetes bacterium]|nr:hypothetical protein [Gemmatimonadota bacterium]